MSERHNSPTPEDPNVNSLRNLDASDYLSKLGEIHREKGVDAFLDALLEDDFRDYRQPEDDPDRKPEDTNRPGHKPDSAEQQIQDVFPPEEKTSSNDARSIDDPGRPN